MVIVKLLSRAVDVDLCLRRLFPRERLYRLDVVSYDFLLGCERRDAGSLGHFGLKTFLDIRRSFERIEIEVDAFVRIYAVLSFALIVFAVQLFVEKTDLFTEELLALASFKAFVDLFVYLVLNVCDICLGKEYLCQSDYPFVEIRFFEDISEAFVIHGLIQGRSATVRKILKILLFDYIVGFFRRESRYVEVSSESVLKDPSCHNRIFILRESCLELFDLYREELSARVSVV